ncbi:MAG: RNA polymerase sigma factor [Rhodothalassiaceae bacterium]
MNDRTPGSHGEERVATGPVSDETLVGRVAVGDRMAFALLVRRHADRFLAMAERVLGDRTEAEDVLQDAFSRFWVHAGRFDPKAARFTTWFYRVVANACTDRLRRRGRTRPLPEGWDTADEGTVGAEAAIAQTQQAVAVRRALDGLPARQRLAVTLCYYEDLTNREAADILGVSVKALESLLVRARRQLRTTLVAEVDR